MPSKSFFRLFLEALKDPILILLMAAAAVSTVLGAAIPEEREQAAWSEGVAIWVAVLIVSLVASGNDYQKDLQFRKLNAQKDVVEIKVRGGERRGGEMGGGGFFSITTNFFFIHVFPPPFFSRSSATAKTCSSPTPTSSSATSSAW